MASPRIFVSSTCYDLQEIRFQLRNFIRDFSYEPVMSEFDDIFYNYESHVQDSCLDEISKCQLFVLIVGNNYGNIFHQDKENAVIPDSVTLREFKKALEINVYKHIFINKFVDYDYKNYKRALDRTMLKHFKENKIDDSKIEIVKAELKKEFDDKYHFPYESYRYVFYFLDIINELKVNNGYNTFESFGDIKESLKKQWAGFMYEGLTKSKKIETKNLKILEEKITNIDNSIKKLVETKSFREGTKISFDISKISKDFDFENLQKLQDKVEKTLLQIFYFEYHSFDLGIMDYVQRVWFNKKLNKKEIESWLRHIEVLVNDYKWSKFIKYNIVFKDVYLFKYNKTNADISYSNIFELNAIYNSLSNEEKESFILTVKQKFDDAFEAPKDNDLPF